MDSRAEEEAMGEVKYHADDLGKCASCGVTSEAAQYAA